MNALNQVGQTSTPISPPRTCIRGALPQDGITSPLEHILRGGQTVDIVS